VKKVYKLESLPTKYHKFYSYAKEVCSLLKHKSPSMKIQNENGNFMIMRNVDNPMFIAKFSSGHKIIHFVSNNRITFYTPDGKCYGLKNKQIYEKFLEYHPEFAKIFTLFTEFWQ